MKASPLFFLACLVGMSTSAAAAPMLYNINFAATVGNAPTSGSFVYDSVTVQFSAFIVEWNSVSFDLTNSANNPVPDIPGNSCDNAAPTAADTFVWLTTGGCSAQQEWVGFSSFSDWNFNFLEADTNYAVLGRTPNTTESSASDFGTFQVEAAVPEPSTMAFMAAGVALLALRKRQVSKLRL